LRWYQLPLLDMRHGEIAVWRGFAGGIKRVSTRKPRFYWAFLIVNDTTELRPQFTSDESLMVLCLWSLAAKNGLREPPTA
jgi:hypothetical protein